MGQGCFKADKSFAEVRHGYVSEHMVRSVEHYPIESVVLVTGMIRKPPQEVKHASIHNAEIQIHEIHLLSHLTENVPFTVYDAENILNLKYQADHDSTDDEEGATTPHRASMQSSRNRDSISQDRSRSQSAGAVHRHHRKLPQRVRLNNRIVDLRTASSQSIFRIQSGVCNLFRSYLDEQGFIEIHTPKLQGGATESGATVFELNYFGRPAFLAQSPQLAKQMCIAADFERVYEIGAVFRAEDSNTPRHLTEYTGLDIEMALDEHYHEALEIIDGMFKNLWKGLYERYGKEIDIISEYYPHTKVEWLEKTPRIPFSKGIQMLIEDGWVNEDGEPPSEYEDLATRAEIRLGQLVKEQYKTDYYILDKFPASVRPFYTMPDPDNDKVSNSFDIFMRGQEILSGGQRIHDAKFLEQRMRKLNLKPETMEEYLEGFRWGAPPHAGAGIGLERLVYLFLNLGNIRLASLFARDPKSLPERPPVVALRHPEASTLTPPWEQIDLENPDAVKTKEYQPLEKLIANYGDAANTSWLDERYQIWRHPETGAAQAYVPYGGHAITVGEPLCDKSQVPQMISAYLDWLKKEKKDLKPIWILVGDRVEEYLGEKFNWRTLSPVAEERSDPRINPADKDHDLARKIRHADKEGVKNYDLPAGKPLPEEFMTKVNAKVKEWHANRTGKQVHLTEIRPWVDQEHRRYFYASSGGKDGEIHAVCVLHQLSPKNGYQVKFSLEFPKAPSGTIESLTLFALKELAASDPDAKQVTFGTGAMPELVGGRNIGKTRVKALKKTYEAINKSRKLTNKSEFREKLGAKDERVYIAYPRGGMGPGGIKAIMGFFGDEEAG